ncbi:MAG TPA: MFS transporter [Stellaceae bacterium]|nr:MFS transporter [Stellaceae bacterium]
MTMREAMSEPGWSMFLAPRLALPLGVLLGGVLLHSMNVLVTATLLPSIVADIGGAALMSWPTTAFVASSIIAASGAGVVSGMLGRRRAFFAGAMIYGGGAVLCALAPSIGVVIVGRFVQGIGGGLLSALAYVLVRNLFPETLWSRVFGLLAGVWSVSIFIGPLVGGVFASYAFWRGAFLAVAAMGGLIGVGALYILRGAAVEDDAASRRFPVVRLALICAAIALLSQASVARGPAEKIGLLVAALGLFGVMLGIDRRAVAPLLPSDAFSLWSPTGTGLWMVLLLAVAYTPPAIYLPLFLQRLHALDPLAAGYMVAVTSGAWTAAALSVAALGEEWQARLIVAGPVAMGAGLAGVAMLTAPGPVAALILPIALIGAGIGGSWAFIVQRVMAGAKSGEENIAAGSVATLQQAGTAFGAALAGLVANASGLADGLDPGAVSRASFWVPMAFVAVPLAAVVISLRLNAISREPAQSPLSGVDPA